MIEKKWLAKNGMDFHQERKTMKSFSHRFRSIFTLAFATQILLLVSCMSTREYVKTTNRLYQDDILIAESETRSFFWRECS